MKRIIFLLSIAVCAQKTIAQFHQSKEPLAHTFSIVARDPKTGEMGVAVQSHWFSVGTAVSWAEAGVGVVATQSFVNKSFGFKGLALMKEGMPASDVLTKLLNEDDGREMRQVAMIDANGSLAAHTGTLCIDYADHITDENFSVQSNMMLTKEVSKSMAEAYKKNQDMPLAERMLAAMQAGQAAGGDIRGQQSAAMLIVPGKSDGKPWDERLVDLRVDDHATPLVEMKRLLKVHRAYEFMNNGDLEVEKGNMAQAMEQYDKAMKMFPENLEMQFWTAITLANNKKVKEASALLQKIYLKDKNWRELTKRLPKVNLLNVSAEHLKTLIQ